MYLLGCCRVCGYTAVMRNDPKILATLLQTQTVVLDEITDNWKTALYLAIPRSQEKNFSAALGYWCEWIYKTDWEKTLLDVAVA